MSEESPNNDARQYNPLATSNLAHSIAVKFLAEPLQELPPPAAVDGAGVYAIYYFGKDPTYRTLAAHNHHSRLPVPLYVGKAVPRGARIGMTADVIGPRVPERLRIHSRRISESDLALADFRCRYLILDSVFVPLGESLLIGLFAPIWNVVVSGFGNNPVGAGRTGQRRSRWDTLHPGREWALQLTPTAEEQAEQDKRRIERHIETTLKNTMPQLLKQFSGPLFSDRDDLS